MDTPLPNSFRQGPDAAEHRQDAVSHGISSSVMPWAVSDSLTGNASMPTRLRMRAGLLPAIVTVTRSARTCTVPR